MRLLPRFLHRHGYHYWCRRVMWYDFEPEYLVTKDGDRVDISTYGGTRRWRHE